MLTKLGKYLVKGELGSGGMGVVYLAEDPRLGRPVALKTMSPEVARNPELLKRFYREAQAAAQLRHPNIVTIYEIDEAEGIPFIAMELLDGEDLEKIIRERRDIPIARKLEIIIEVCKGLNYAHERGIVHRDIKPGNIEVLKDGQVKLVDFGIARVGGSSMTRTGDVLGTVMYMSPEQLQGLTVDARSDLFSLGIIVHEFLTFQHPFPGNDVPQIIYKIANEQPEPVTKFLPQCPPQLENIISRVLTKNREQRYQTAADLAFDLEQVADNLRRNMVEVYLQQGQRSLNEGNFTVAKVSLHKVLEIDSTHELAKELLAQVQDSLRSRQQAEKIEQLMSRAKEAFQGKQYGDALGSLEEVLRLEPEHAEAQKYKQLVTQEKERDDNIRQHLERAEKFAGDAAYQQAKAELEALLVIDTKNSAALKMMDWVTKELVQQERLHQVRQFIKDARVQLAEKDFPKALELLAKARKLDAINIEVETLTRLVQSAQEKEERQQLLTQRLAQIEEILNREQFDQALAQAEETLQKFPDDPQVLKLHARVVRRAEGQKKRQFADEQIKAARASLEKSEYSAAITILEATIQAVPDDARLVTFLKSVKETQEQAALEGQRRETIREANEQIRAQKYIAAIEILEKAKVRVGESPELKELLQFARERAAELQRDEQIHNVLSRAQSYLSDKDFPKALELLAKARKLDANNIEVEALARLIQSAQEKEERQQLLTQRLAQIEEILNREQFDQALAQAEETLQKFPDDPQVLKLHARVVRRAEGQKKRQFADEQIKAARASLEKSEYSAAITILEATIQAVPDDARLVTFLKSVKETQEQAALEGQRRETIREANEQIRAQKYIAAIEILEKAKVRVGESPELKELLQFARERATELQRDDLIHNVLSRAQTLLQDEHFEEAVQVLEQAQGELKGEQITDALTSARNELQLFERRRGEIIASALHLLQTGEAARAVALFESARKVYFKNEEFQRAYSQCRQNLERASSIRNAEEEVEKSLAKEDIASAESVLEQALKVYADEPTLLTLKKRVQEESLRLRRYHLSERLGEAQVALGRMDYKRTIELLAPVLQESADIPELAKQAKFLQQEAERRGREAGVPQLDLRAALRGPAAGAKSEAVFAPIAAKKSRTILWVGAGAVIFVLAVIGAWRYFAGGGGAPGDLQLTAAPWAEVVSVKTASGQNMNITGETPMLLSLPAGQYVIELKNGQAKGELKVEVGAGKPTVVNYSFPEVKIDDLVQELVSK